MISSVVLENFRTIISKIMCHMIKSPWFYIIWTIICRVLWNLILEKWSLMPLAHYYISVKMVIAVNFSLAYQNIDYSKTWVIWHILINLSLITLVFCGQESKFLSLQNNSKFELLCQYITKYLACICRIHMFYQLLHAVQAQDQPLQLQPTWRQQHLGLRLMDPYSAHHRWIQWLGSNQPLDWQAGLVLFLSPLDKTLSGNLDILLHCQILVARCYSYLKLDRLSFLRKFYKIPKLRYYVSKVRYIFNISIMLSLLIV